MKKAMKQSKLTFLLNFGSILLLLAIAISFFCFINVSNKIDTANENRFDLTLNANRFMNGSSYLTNEVRGFATTGEKAHFDNYWNEINNLKNRDLGVENMTQIGLTKEENETVKQMQSLSNNLVPLEEDAMKKTQDGDKTSAVNYVYGTEYSETIKQIDTLKTSFLNMLDTRTKTQINSLLWARSVIRIFLIMFIVLIVVLQIFSFGVIRKKILKPILAVQEEMTEISLGNLDKEFLLEPDTSEIGHLIGAMIQTRAELKKYIEDISKNLLLMAQGDMRVDITIDYIGSFQPIKKSMQNIVDSLNGTLSEISNAADVVAVGSEQTASGVQNISQGSASQASALEELSATVSDINQQVKETAKNASDADEVTKGVQGALMGSNEKMIEMTTAIEQIRDKSKEIERIIKTIEDIARQTNILALNAAVEAARAGNAGKGFAVVAEEVRNLATKSAEAARSTSELIEETIKAVENGTAITGETAKSMDEVVTGAQQVMIFVDKISSAVSDQSEKIGYINQGLEQIAGTLQTSTASVQQSAASTEEMSSQAQLVKELVDRFQLKKDSNN